MAQQSTRRRGGRGPRGAHAAGRRRDQRHQRHRRERAQGHAPPAVLALVRGQRQRARPGLRLVPLRLRHLVLAGRRRRRRRASSSRSCSAASSRSPASAARRPTLVLSRAAFGVNGNRVPSVLSWVLTVGWETVLVSLATLATSTVFTQLGWSGGTATKVVALLVVAALVVAGGVLGFDLIMRMQTVITDRHRRPDRRLHRARRLGDRLVGGHLGAVRARRRPSSARSSSS